MPFTDEQLTAMRGGLTAEEYRWKLIRSGARNNCRRFGRRVALILANSLVAQREALDGGKTRGPLRSPMGGPVTRQEYLATLVA